MASEFQASEFPSATMPWEPNPLVVIEPILQVPLIRALEFLIYDPAVAHMPKASEPFVTMAA